MSLMSLCLSLVNFEYLFFTKLHTIRSAKFSNFYLVRKASTIDRRGQPSESYEDLVDRKSMDVAFPEGCRPTSPD